MENAMQNGQPKAVATKEQIAEYVKDLTELEEREFVLRKVANELIKEATSLIKNACNKDKSELNSLKELRDQQEIQNIKKHIETNTKKYFNLMNRYSPPSSDVVITAPIPPKKPDCYKEYETTESILNDWKKHGGNIERTKEGDWKITYDNFDGVGCVWMLGLLGLGFLALIISGIVSEIFSLNHNTFISITIILVILFSIIFTLYAILRRIKFKKKEQKILKLIPHHNSIRKIIEIYNEDTAHYMQLSRQYDSITTLQQKLYDIEQPIENVFIKNSSAIEFLQCQARTFLKQADEIALLKKDFYQIGNIPYKYWSFDACVILDAIFHDKLANTLDDALTEYIELKLHYPFICSAEEIYLSINNLPPAMKTIQNRFVSIKHSVDSIVEETKTISNQLYSIDKAAQNT